MSASLGLIWTGLDWLVLALPCLVLAVLVWLGLPLTAYCFAWAELPSKWMT